MGRPRKYASDAERQAAYRARWARLSVDIEAQTVETVRKISEATDTAQSEVVNQLLKFALLNRNWLDGTAFPFKSLRKMSGNVRRQNPDGSYTEE